MLKSELIDRLADQLNHLSLQEVAQGVNVIVRSMANTLSATGRIEIRGFGSISLRYHPPRKAHNPKTGVRLVTEGNHRPHFKPGKELRTRVDGSNS